MREFLGKGLRYIGRGLICRRYSALDLAWLWPLLDAMGEDNWRMALCFMLLGFLFGIAQTVAWPDR